MIDLGDELADYDGATPKRTYNLADLPSSLGEPTCLGTLKELQDNGFNKRPPGYELIVGYISDDGIT
jgi:hypothetical protein